MLAHFAVILRQLLGKTNPPPEPAAGHASGALIPALAAQALGIAVAIVAACMDATEKTYQIAWLVVGPAALGLTALAFALSVVGRPRPRNGVAEVFMWLAFAAAVGITACYGAVFA